MRESRNDALHDGRRIGARGRGRVRVGAAARRGMPGVPGRARGAVPARDRWPAVRNAVVAERRRRRERWGVSGLAAAAVLAGLLVFRPFWTKPVDAAELARVKEQSATLEQQLQRYDPNGRVTSGRSAALAAALEDRIAVIDGELAQLGPSQAQAHSADLVNVWQQRGDLREQLMSVRVTRAAYVGL